MDESLTSSRVVARNALFNTVGYVVTVLYAFILVPLVLHFIGTEHFGLWAVVTALTGYIGLADLGVVISIVKFVAEYASLGETERVNSVIRHGVLFYGVSACVFLILGLIASTFVFGLLNIPPAQQELARQALMLALAGYGITSMTSVFASVMHGLQRMDMANVLMSGAAVARLLGIGAALWMGGGLLGLLMADFCVSTVVLIVMLMGARRVFPDFRFTLGPYQGSMMARLVKFGAQLSVAKVADLVQGHYDKFPISRYVGLTAVSMYDFGARPLGRLKGFPLTVLTTMLPTVSALHAEDNRKRIQAALLRATRYVTILALPMFAFAACFSDELLHFWLGRPFPQAALAMRLLAAAYFAGVTVGPLAFIAQGSGEPQYQMRAALIQVLANIILSTVLARQFGFIGAVLGTLAASLLGAFIFVGTYGKLVVENPVMVFARLAAKPLISVVPAIAAGMALARLLLGNGDAHTRGTLLLVLAAAGVVVLALYAGMLTLTKTFSGDDRGFLVNILPTRLRKRFARHEGEA